MPLLKCDYFAAATAIPQGPHENQDNEVDDLKAELTRIREELKIAISERDHLRSQDKRIEEQGEILRNGASSKSDTKAEYVELRGQSKAKCVEDSRIGQPKRILVVGGGPAGLISLHELLNPFNRPEGRSLDGYDISLYERRADVGGVWYFEPENDIAKGWHHGAFGLRLQAEERLARNNTTDTSPVQDPTANKTNGDPHILVNGHVNGHAQGKHDSIPNGPPRHDSGAQGDFCYLSYPQTAPRWPSPAYEGLVGNVLPPLLEFSAERFQKPSGGLFPSMTETHQYLLDLAQPLRKHIKTCREVIGARPVWRSGASAASWEVESIDWSQDDGRGARTTEDWDALITAAGAFDHPYWPETPGLDALKEKKSDLIMHAKTYPGPRPFAGQHNKIVVVGNANSANDIAAHLAPLNSSGPLYRCVRHESKFAHLPDSRIKDVPPIANISESADGQTLTLILDDGTIIDGVTKLIFASGYQFNFPWLSVPSLTSEVPSTDSLVPASTFGAVPNLYNTTFHAGAPTLAFIGLSTGSTPMPLAEIQARTAARTFHGVMSLPQTREGMLADYLERADELGLKEGVPDNWRTLHMIRGPPERVITQRLLDDLEAGEKGASDGLFRWDEWREGIVKTMRTVKEGELRRLRDAKVSAGGVDGGVGGVLSYGVSVGQTFEPKTESADTADGETNGERGKSLML